MQSFYNVVCKNDLISTLKVIAGIQWGLVGIWVRGVKNDQKFPKQNVCSTFKIAFQNSKN